MKARRTLGPARPARGRGGPDKGGHDGAPARLLELQRAAGNQAVRQVLERAPDARRSRALAPGQTHVAAAPVQRGFWKKVKKGLKKVGSAIKKGVTKVGSGIKKGAQAVGKAFKKVGRLIKKGAKAVWTGITWTSKQLWTKLKGIGLRAFQWAKKLPTRLRRLVSHLWTGVKALKPWSLKWWRSLGKAGTWKDFGKWLGQLVIYGLETMGIGEIYETVADFIKFNTRALTGPEKAEAQKVFGSAIPYGLVRIDEGALIGPTWSGRAYVSFHTINDWGKEIRSNKRLLIHELTHVWQYDTMGAMYMPRAIHGQTAGYNYGGVQELEARRASGKGITSFHPEGQGEILGDYYSIHVLGQDPRHQEGWSGSDDDKQAYAHFAGQVRR